MKLSEEKPKNINTITVIGAGLMGHGIAQEFATAGFGVYLHDINEEQLNSAHEQIDKNLRLLADNGVIDKHNIPEIMQRVNFTNEHVAPLYLATVRL